MPKIAIVLPVFNTGLYLQECLDSIFNQTYKDFTIYAVDDGSTDNSLEILHEYQRIDTRLKVYTQANQGVSGARNTALKAISEESLYPDYVLFVDSDDKLKKDCLKQCVTEINGVDLLVFCIARFNRSGVCPSNRAMPQNEILDHDQFCELYFRLGKWQKSYTVTFSGLSNKCLPYSLICGNYFDPALKIAEDQEFFIKILPAIKKVKVISEVLYLYRLRESSLTHSKKEFGFTDDFRIFKKFIGDSKFSNSMRIGIQHRYIQTLWMDLQRVLHSSVSLSQKKNFYTQAVKFASIPFAYPYQDKDKKRLHIIRMGFFINLIATYLKKLRKKQSKLDQ